MSLTIKAFLYKRWGKEPAEIRRFIVDQDVSTSYAYLTQKIAQVFPSLTTDNIIVCWTDSDGDRIVISSDEELVEALDQFDGSIFRLHVKKRESDFTQQPSFSGPPREQPPTLESESENEDEEGRQEGEEKAGTQQQQPHPEGIFHPGVICDGCRGPIYGARYKCLVCNDYDLCSACEGKGLHVEHNMVTIHDPYSYNPWGFPHGRRPPFHGRPGCHGHWRHHHGFGPRHFGHSRPGCGFGPRHGWGHHGHPPMWSPWAGPYFRGWGQGGYGECGQRRNCCPKQEHPANKQGAEPMETAQPGQNKELSEEEQAQLHQEQRRSYLQDIGEAVSNLLQPFGVKVDVDVVDESQQKPTTTTTSQEGDATAPPSVPSGASVNTAYPSQYTVDPASPLQSGGAEPSTTPLQDLPGASTDLEQTVAQLRGMGFDDEGGWLTELVKAKGGDIGKVLDALNPGQSS